MTAFASCFLWVFYLGKLQSRIEHAYSCMNVCSFHISIVIITLFELYSTMYVYEYA